MGFQCTLCKHGLESLFVLACPNCGASQEPVREERKRLLVAAEVIKDGLRDATRRSEACPHACPWSSVAIDIPGCVRYSTSMRRCVYEWFAAEYPPDGEITHDVFHYPV